MISWVVLDAAILADRDAAMLLHASKYIASPICEGFGRRSPVATRCRLTSTTPATTRITLPSGNWEVKKLAFKVTPEDPARVASEGESLFSPQLGVIVKTHRVGESASAQSTSETTTELISVES
jgi:hypothetical protein